MELRFHALATAEFREARDWCEERGPRVADRFTDAVQAAYQRIRNDPESHPIAWKWFRSIAVSRFTFRIFFEQLDDTRILIVAVSHSSRRPHYWRSRS